MALSFIAKENIISGLHKCMLCAIIILGDFFGKYFIAERVFYEKEEKTGY